ncbi:MAG TPA: esterase-like activity of phytase family protein [Hyphomicrobiaceae bacterium]|nr:esterase-like activity of phytase family protein [Hyphomicrobiaceae bacterium]
MRTKLALAALLICGTAEAADFQVLTSKDPKLAWKSVELPGGKTASYTLGIGSGAYRHPSDPPNVIWTIGDRGPNMTCGDAAKLIGKEVADACKKLKDGRVYPTPEYVPSIYRVEIDRAAGTFKLLDVIPIKTKSGKPVTGLLNPQTKATRDTGMDLAGNVLPYDPDNIDLEGIVRLSDGTFWIGEEMGPSVAHVSADGRLLERYVPADAAEDYRGSEAAIVASLPAILSKRQGNRGIESIAVSPDEAFLYFIMQNPLANPDAKTYQQAKNTRLFKFERATGRLLGEYVYQLDDPQSFGLDPSTKQNDPRISELTALGTDRLLVLERTEGTTKLYEITLAGATDILGSKWDDASTSPSLEQENDLAKLSITAVKKTLRFDSAKDMKDAPVKIEGVTFLGDGAMVMINDNDFGITGAETSIVLIKGAVSADPAVYRK